MRCLLVDDAASEYLYLKRKLPDIDFYWLPTVTSARQFLEIGEEFDLIVCDYVRTLDSDFSRRILAEVGRKRTVVVSSEVEPLEKTGFEFVLKDSLDKFLEGTWKKMAGKNISAISSQS